MVGFLFYSKKEQMDCREKVDLETEDSGLDRERLAGLVAAILELEEYLTCIV